MRAEIVSFLIGIGINSLKHYIEGVIGQTLWDYILNKVINLPRILHFVYRHAGPSRNCTKCKA